MSYIQINSLTSLFQMERKKESETKSKNGIVVYTYSGFIWHWSVVLSRNKDDSFVHCFRTLYLKKYILPLGLTFTFHNFFCHPHFVGNTYFTVFYCFKLKICNPTQRWEINCWLFPAKIQRYYLRLALYI